MTICYKKGQRIPKEVEHDCPWPDGTGRSAPVVFNHPMKNCYGLLYIRYADDFDPGYKSAFSNCVRFMKKTLVGYYLA